MTVQQFSVHGMTCQGCVRSVTRAIERLAPGAKVEVALETGDVRVESDRPAAEIARAIIAAGYEVRGGV